MFLKKLKFINYIIMSIIYKLSFAKISFQKIRGINFIIKNQPQTKKFPHFLWQIIKYFKNKSKRPNSIFFRSTPKLLI